MEPTYTLTRTKRRTISISVRPDLSVSVRAPLRMSNKDIDRFVQSHRQWIQMQQDRLAVSAEKRSGFHFADGQTIPYRGEDVTLATGHSVTLEPGRLWLPQGENRARDVARFLRERAGELVECSIARHAAALGVAPAGVKITSAATRWGSCSGKNNLCFSWRVACLPDELLEYVVVHELAHIREHNHSPQFWAVVEAELPDWAWRRSRLRAFQERILF